MRTKWIFFLSLNLWTLAALAQAPFTGGVGDGYARASLTLLTRLEAPESSMRIRVFPQPVAVGGEVHIEYRGQKGGQWQLLDAQGRVVRSGAWQRETLALSTRELPTGLYVWHLQAQTRRIQQKIWIVSGN